MCISFTSSVLITRLCRFNVVSMSLLSFVLFATIFPTTLLFLSRRLKGPSSLRRWGLLCAGRGVATGGKEQTLCLENGKMVRSLNVARGGPPIDRLRTRLAEYLRVIVLHPRRWDSRARSRISMCFVFGLAVPESAAQLCRQQAEGRRWGKGLLVCLVVFTQRFKPVEIFQTHKCCHPVKGFMPKGYFL